jgi:hypothetical protein
MFLNISKEMALYFTVYFLPYSCFSIIAISNCRKWWGNLFLSLIKLEIIMFINPNSTDRNIKIASFSPSILYV